MVDLAGGQKFLLDSSLFVSKTDIATKHISNARPIICGQRKQWQKKKSIYVAMSVNGIDYLKKISKDYLSSY